MSPLFKRRKRVLLLDDDPSMQRLVARILGNQGFRVDVFLTGSQAIAALKKEKYDVLLLDLMMPHEGGMTVIRHLRKNDPPVLKRSILLTASPDSLIDALSGEVKTVVQKPFEPQQLIDAVRLMSES
ncbi:MAG: two-component system, OmpR family, response regulator TctD [Thermoanaerobaculia bacterium]|jgi:DNA-binding response OmpR family regulator|nr:two-component system, OmpR family, response regulator TctD [Thermoanaerobaculia bacterium]